MNEESVAPRNSYSARAATIVPTPLLQVPPSVIGQTHSFHHDGHEVEVSIPTADIEALVARAEAHEYWDEQERVRLLSWNPTEKKAKDVAVSSVDISCALPEAIIIHPDMLTRPANARELLNDSEAQALDDACKSADAVLSSAFSKWLSVLRWKSRDATIGQGELGLHQTQYGTRLLAVPSMAQVWAGGIGATIVMKKAITHDAWEETGQALATGLETPIFWATFLDAVVNLHRGDFRTSTVLAAVAAEVFMRSKVSESLPTLLSHPLRDYIDDMNVRPLMTKAFPELLSQLGLKKFNKLKSELHQLFNMRNDIVHKGLTLQVERQAVERFRDAAESLLELGENQSFWN